MTTDLQTPVTTMDGEIARWFDKHQATFHAFPTDDPEEYGLLTLTWKRPGDGMYSIRYVIQGPVLMVWGDLECAVYRWSQIISWDFLAGCDLQYFESKCEASTKGRDYEEFDSQLALRQFDEELARRVEEGYSPPHPREVEEGRKALRCGRDEWNEWARYNGSKIFGGDWWDWLPGLGMSIAMTCTAHLIGIKMAVAQRKEKGGRS